MLRLIWAEYFSEQKTMSTWSYIVHGKSRAFFDRARTIGQTATETAVKLRAITCHKTQLKLSRKRFLDHAKQAERFVRLGSREMIDADGAISSISRRPSSLSVSLQRSLNPMRPTKPALFILGHDEIGTLRCVRMRLPVLSSNIEMFDCVTQKRLNTARYGGDVSAGTLAIPLDMFSPNDALFVKLERRGWFFDEAGWLELPPAAGAEPIVVGDDFFPDREVEEAALLRK